MPRAMGRSKRPESLGRSAGARLTVRQDVGLKNERGTSILYNLSLLYQVREGYMESKLELHFFETRYGVRSLYKAVLQKTDWPAEVVRWMWPAMVDLAKQSELQPSTKTTWDCLKHAIPALARVRSWQRFASTPITELEVEDVRDFFVDLDSAFHVIWKPEGAAIRSSALRRFILGYLKSTPNGDRLSRVKGTYQPRPRIRANHRPLIDDVIEIHDGKALGPPIGAIPHATPKQLKDETRNRLVSTLERIQVACLRELDDYRYSCWVLQELRNRPENHAAEISALKKVSGGAHTLRADFLSKVTPAEWEALISYYLRKDYQANAKFEKSGYVGSSLLEDDLSLRMGLSPIPFIRCSRYECYPLQVTLIAAAVLIQIVTGWNASSVLRLSAKGITPLAGGGYLVQSVKQKTGLDTPQVLLEGEDNPGVVAVRFLLERLERLRARRWIRPDESELWLSPRSNYQSRRGMQISNVANGLSSLIEKHQLPKFTFDQLRVQALTVISITSGPVRAAEVAGHSTFSSIGGYIDHLITQRINSSVNLEFQKRWEKEVLDTIANRPHARPLVPVGDGSSCVNPNTPPDNDWLREGVCQAEYCHAGSGCPNRAIVIDRARIQEVLLTAQFYQSNWKSLYAANPKEFAEIHLPRIEFNFLLKNYLEKGPYRQHINGRT